ncbi:hypothetical protein QBC32DRAFT_315234 [Pseudoneurospora amorphoporcata]|uniref:Uncharacterized protein n=1 Tax=Pseudoneurospora amorphoporcata TaxID=241081 RepID=A0AAN6NU77_9PEZI|nr:hypothetical protein QBC32DRAFT_315234 [Pseudoneurospora amorphoporcata]
MCFTRYVKSPLTAWLFGALIQAAFADEIQSNPAVQILVPQLDPANTNVVTGIAVSYSSPLTTSISTSTSTSTKIAEKHEAEVSNLYATTITITSTKPGTKTPDSSVSRPLKSPESSLPLQSKADSTAAVPTSAPKKSSTATVTTTSMSKTSTASSGEHRFNPSAWSSHQSEKSKSAATATTKTSARKTTVEPSSPTSTERDLPGGAVNSKDGVRNESGCGMETPSMTAAFAAAVLTIIVQAGMAIGIVAHEAEEGDE